jgi:anhydro-N-acetylmuramic acid kinase
MIKYSVIGLMSGTSIDGVDIACCEFEKVRNTWNFKVLVADTIQYDNIWKKRLQEAHLVKDVKDFLMLDKEYGAFLGQHVNHFIERHGVSCQIIASHGHTVFHEPEKKITVQLGHGASIAAITGITTINDFRSMDVALNGQGAPLVPVGDQLLFNNYDYCLNLGGFANISFTNFKKRIAFDVCPVNTVLNAMAIKLNKPFDRKGEIGEEGEIIDNLLLKLNNLPYYYLDPPKSLAREWLEKDFLPLIEPCKNIPHILRTLYEHIADQVSTSVKCSKDNKVLVTGGGAYNSFLMSRIKSKSAAEFQLPDPVLIDFKEALIFAFLGVLRHRNEINCLASVTGADRDSICGTIHPGRI